MEFGRNLDWGMQNLADQTILLQRKGAKGTSVASVTFPGYIGCLSAMNNHGVAASILKQGRHFVGGKSNALYFYELLSKTNNAEEFHQSVMKANLCGTMNVMVADENGAYRYWFAKNGEGENEKVFEQLSMARGV